MNEIEAVKFLMKSKHVSNAVLADKLGYTTASAVSNRLQSKTMTVETLLKLLDALGCELIVRDKSSHENIFNLTNENRTDAKIYKRNNER